jgi:succinyl-CoA synthetase beta subunit
LDLFEYQGKEMLRRFEVPVPEGRVASTPDEAAAAAAGLGGKVVVKAQVQVGGRGKAGGIKIAESEDEARKVAEAILGMDIKGHTVKRVLVERAGDIKEEYYLSFLVDRGERKFLGMMSAEGGVEIEQVAEENPDAIARVHIDPSLGISDFHARKLVFGSKVNPEARKGAIAMIPKLYRAFVELDASLVEVNPLVLTGDGKVVALDGKLFV